MNLKIITIILKLALAIYKWYSVNKAKDEDKEELKKLRGMLIEASKFNGHVDDILNSVEGMTNEELKNYFDR